MAAVALRALLLIFALGACKRAQPPVNGIGEFELARTTLASVEARSLACHHNEAEGITRCWVDTRQSIAGRAPKVELVFAGHEPASPLAEILLEVPGCNLDELRSWFESRMGAPTSEADGRVTWAQQHIHLVVRTTGPARCLATAVSPDDAERVERIGR